MATLQTLPPCLLATIMEESPDARSLLHLVQSSSLFESLLKQYHVGILRKVAQNTLPSNWELVCDALQTHCSAKRMVLTEAGEEGRDSWKVSSGLHDIFNSNYMGDCIDVLRQFADLSSEIRARTDLLLKRQGSIAPADRDAVDEVFWKMELIKLRDHNIPQPKALIDVERAARTKMREPFLRNDHCFLRLRGRHKQSGDREIMALSRGVEEAYDTAMKHDVFSRLQVRTVTILECILWDWRAQILKEVEIAYLKRLMM